MRRLALPDCPIIRRGSLALEAVRVELENAGVLGDGALDVLGGAVGDLGCDLVGDPQPRAGESREVGEDLVGYLAGRRWP